MSNAEPAVNAGQTPPQPGPGRPGTTIENYPEPARPGPDVSSAPVDLYGAGESPAPDGLGYGQRPAEADLWAFTVAQAHEAMDQMTAGTSPHDAEVKLDGPFTTDTVQDGLQTYGA